MPINVAKIYSTLGNPDSLIPLALKDSVATTGMTCGSYITGKEEGFDRLIDEIGTEAIWLGGLPFYKALFNWAGFKPFKLDHKFDARILKDNDIFEKAKELAPNEQVKKEIEKIGKNKKLFKGLAMSKFFVATALTVGSYVGLTKFKHHYTAKKIRENLIKEHQDNEKSINNGNTSDLSKTEQAKTQNIQPAFKEKEANMQYPSFKGVGTTLESFMFSPVKNMWILDGCITGERIRDSRTPQEAVGYGIKEASTLCFMYYAGGKIQELAEKYIKKTHNKSIALDARVIEGNLLKKVFEDASIEKSLKEFEEVKGKKVELYEFLHKNPENIVVMCAKQTSSGKKNADIIEVFEKTNKIDTRKYIDLKEVEGVHSNLQELYKQYKTALSNGESSEHFFSKLKKLKRKSIRLNIGSCMLALGVITPAIMVIKRFTDKDGSEFRTKEIIRKQLQDEGVIAKK